MNETGDSSREECNCGINMKLKTLSFVQTDSDRTLEVAS